MHILPKHCCISLTTNAIVHNNFPKYFAMTLCAFVKKLQTCIGSHGMQFRLFNETPRFTFFQYPKNETILITKVHKSCTPLKHYLHILVETIFTDKRNRFSPRLLIYTHDTNDNTLTDLATPLSTCLGPGKTPSFFVGQAQNIQSKRDMHK